MTARTPTPRAAIAGLLALVGLVLVPVTVVVGSGVLDAAISGRWAGILASPVTQRSLGNSLLQGTLAAAGAMALGGPAGAALGRYRFPGRDVLVGVLQVPFVLPTLSMVVAVGALFGTSGLLGGPFPLMRGLGSGLPGVVVSDVLYNAPLVALLTAVGAETADPSIEESVRVLGGSEWRAFRDAWGPPALRGAAAGGALTFALSALAFAAPLALGGPANFTVEARIWSLDQQLAAPASAEVVASLGLAVLAPALGLYLWLGRRIAPGSAGARSPARPLSRHDPVGVGLLAALGVLAGLEFLVLGSVVARLAAPASPRFGSEPALYALLDPRSFGYENLPLPDALANSLIFAGLAAGLALLWGLSLATVRRRRSPMAGVARVAPLAGLFVSPIILALGLATAVRPLTGLSGVWLLIVAAQATIALPFVAEGLALALGRVPPSLREAAATLGSAPGPAFLEIELPAARSGIVSAALLAVAICLGEFAATYFLVIPRFATASVDLYQLEGARLVPEAAALAGLLALISAGLLAVASAGGQRVRL